MNNDFKPFRPAGGRPPANPNHQNSSETPFKTPEQAAAADIGSVAVPVKAGKRKKRSLWQHLRHPDLTRKQIIIISVVVGLIIAAFLIWWFAIRKDAEPTKPTPPPVAKKEEPPKPTTVPSRLSGLPVAPEVDATMPTTGVMIENSPDARPQAGLIDAGVVFEAIAEGGITRFLAIFQETKPGYIGPVRSVRPYYLDFLAPFDAAIAHAGGSAQALAEVRTQGFKDLDHGANGSTYQRVGNRFAPHNLYTSRDALLAAQVKRGWPTSNFTGFQPRKAGKALAAPTIKSIDLAISSFLYNPHFDYDTTCNCYLRSEGGKPHVDEKTSIQIRPQAVVALVMSHRYAGIYSVYGVTGGGTAFYFQDGAMVQGSWQKPDRKSQFKFLDSAGTPFALNAGQTWVSIVSAPTAVVYKP